MTIPEGLMLEEENYVGSKHQLVFSGSIVVSGNVVRSFEPQFRTHQERASQPVSEYRFYS
jgi:hypothetical protein